MATRRTSFDKLQRERAKRAKQAEKRERRQEKAAGLGEDDEFESEPLPDEPLSAGELMQRLEALQNRYDAKLIDFDSYDDEKRELLERLAALPME